MSKYCYCPNCGDNLEEQKGFFKEIDYWRCKSCGYLLTNPQEMNNHKMRYENVVWTCDKCGAYLNKQKGFSDWQDTWTCTECGHINPISETEIYVSETASQRSRYADEYRDGVDELTLPCGTFWLSFDGCKEKFRYRSLPPDEKEYPDVDATYRIYYPYVADGQGHELKICFSCNTDGEIESDERTEELSFYVGDGKVTIGCEASFGLNEYPYDGTHKKDGIVLYLSDSTPSQLFVFGLCWLEHCTPETDSQTCEAAQTTYINLNGVKINEYDKILLRNGKTATVVEILEEGREYIVDVDLPNTDWETIEISHEDIKMVL